jgi:hypothetical protein
MRWNQGRAEIDKLIAAGELQRVPELPVAIFLITDRAQGPRI